MRADPFVLAASDAAELYVHRWLPEPAVAPRAVIHVVHGMGEHAARYARAAEPLTRAGYVVIASDLRGHGRTAGSEAALGHFGDRDGWNRVVADLREIDDATALAFPSLKRVLLGHSMGSLLAEQFLQEAGDRLAGVALSGSPGHTGALRPLALWIARFERWRLGVRGRSPLLRWLIFGRANKAFAPARTGYDWLSRDPAEVDAYVADPRCGFALSAGSLCDMFEALGRIQSPAASRSAPKGLPMHVFSGEDDPVHEGLAALHRMIDAYRSAGLERVTQRFYAGARHEVLNETNRDAVLLDLMRWLDGVVGQPD